MTYAENIQQAAEMMAELDWAIGGAESFRFWERLPEYLQSTGWSDIPKDIKQPYIDKFIPFPLKAVEMQVQGFDEGRNSANLNATYEVHILRDNISEYKQDLGLIKNDEK